MINSAHHQLLQSLFAVSSELSETLLNLGTIEVISQDHIIHDQNITPDSVIFLLSGLVGLFTFSFEGKEFYDGFLTPGTIMHDDYLIDQSLYISHSLALTDVIILKIPFSSTQALYDNTHYLQLVNRSVIRKLSINRNLRHVFREKDIVKKIHTLLALLLRFAQGSTIIITHEQLAQLTGSSRNSIGKVLKRLELQSIIDCNRRTIKWGVNKHRLLSSSL
ncbi:Crp/Fnr family transcriptional regulator [Endozoicomonas sp.]|uniref:Crp/Fnr family transcriptional regulator n=1 Tax=Endozoicomonas sp. TaxID=1892382 RepID=UPI00383B1FD1